jgi:hypothetical protein
MNCVHGGHINADYGNGQIVESEMVELRWPICFAEPVSAFAEQPCGVGRRCSL